MLLTRMVAALPDPTLLCLRSAVARFDAFTEDNDPYRERDFGAIELEGSGTSGRSTTTIDRFGSGLKTPPTPPRPCGC